MATKGVKKKTLRKSVRPKVTVLVRHSFEGRGTLGGRSVTGSLVEKEANKDKDPTKIRET